MGKDVNRITASYRFGRNTTGLCGTDHAVRDGTRQENPTRKSNKQVLRREQILEFCVEPKSLFDILQHLGLKNRENLIEVYINPMIGAGVLAMRIHLACLTQRIYYSETKPTAFCHSKGLLAWMKEGDYSNRLEIIPGI